jgi:hypothetical protein
MASHLEESLMKCIKTNVLEPIVSYLKSNKSVDITIEELMKVVSMTPPSKKINPPISSTNSTSNSVKSVSSSSFVPTETCVKVLYEGTPRQKVCGRPSLMGAKHCKTHKKDNNNVSSPPDSGTAAATPVSSPPATADDDDDNDVSQYPTMDMMECVDDKRNLYRDMHNSYAVHIIDCEHPTHNNMTVIGMFKGSKVVPLDDDQKSEALKHGFTVNESMYESLANDKQKSSKSKTVDESADESQKSSKSKSNKHKSDNEETNDKPKSNKHKSDNEETNDKPKSNKHKPKSDELVDENEDTDGNDELMKIPTRMLKDKASKSSAKKDTIVSSKTEIPPVVNPRRKTPDKMPNLDLQNNDDDDNDNAETNDDDNNVETNDDNDDADTDHDELDQKITIPPAPQSIKISPDFKSLKNKPPTKVIH